MNCVCGHSVFDHAKVHELRQWVGGDGTVYTPEHGPMFTLSGRCKACDAADSAIGRSVICVQFRPSYSLADVLRNEANFWRDVCDMDPRPLHGMSREMVARPATFVDEATPISPGLENIVAGAKPWGGLPNATGAQAIDRDLTEFLKTAMFEGLDRGLPALEWWKKYAREPEPGPSEVM